MRVKKLQRGIRLMAYCLMIATIAILMNNNLNQIFTMDKYFISSIPEPRTTKPKWCSSDYYLETNDTGFVEDLLALPPPVFEEDYKNPCFYDACHYMERVEVKKLRCLPYFHVLGVDKCGSTDLYTRIAKHPQVLPNNGSLGKETMWWSWKRYGDGTPMDFWDFSGWPMIPQNYNLTEPKILTPHLIKFINPDAKFILIFREPAERLYSDYMFLGIGKSLPKVFHKKVEKALTMFNSCVQQNSLRICLFSREMHVKLPVRLHVGMYSTFLMEWLQVFPIQQFLFLRNEDYSKDIKGTLEEVFRFLDLEPLTNTTMQQIASSRRAHQTARKKKAGQMEKRTKKLLQKFYAPFNRQLTALLNDLRFLWKDIR